MSLIRQLGISFLALCSVHAAADLQSEVDAAFESQKSTSQLIEMAVQETNEDNLSNNIRARAYFYLSEQMARPSSRKLIVKNRDRFVADWRKTKNNFVRSKIASLLLKLNLPSQTQSEVLFDYFADLRLSLDPKGLREEERRLAPLLQKLANAPDKIQGLTKILNLVETRLFVSARLSEEALRIVQAWIPALPQESVDEAVRARFRFAEMVAEQKKRFEQNPNQNQLTIWLFATPAEVASLIASFDKAVCSHPLKRGLKTWQYDYILPGRSETQFLDQHQRLQCKT